MRGLTTISGVEGAQRFRREIEQLVTSGGVRQAVDRELPALRHSLADAFADVMVERFVLPAFRDWKAGRVRTLADLKPRIENEFKKWLKSQAGKDHLSEIVLRWFEELGSELEELTDPVCRRYGVPTEALSLAPGAMLSSHQVEVGGIDPTEIIGYDALANLVGVVVVIVVAVISGGAGAALIATGPIGWLIGGAVAVIAVAIGQEAAREWVENADLRGRWLVPRGRVENKIRENKPGMKAEILKGLENPEVAKEMSDGITDAVREQLRKGAESVIGTIK